MGLLRTEGCKEKLKPYIKSQAVYSFCRTFCHSFRPLKHSRPFVRIAEDGTATWLAAHLDPLSSEKRAVAKIFRKPY